MKKIGEPLFKAIKQVMKELQINEIEEKNINISYFSGENFLKFLEFRKYYVEFFEKDPYILLNYLYENWKKKIFFKKNNFRDFIINENIA